MRDLRSYLSLMYRSISMDSEASSPPRDIVGGGLLFGLYSWLDFVFPVERIF